MTDHLSSVRAVVEGVTGSVVEARDYYAYGLEMAGRVWVSGQKAREGYTGHQLDAETGWNYAGARYYAPALARWMVVDPLAETYPSLSPYNYVAGDPANAFDPDGRLIIFVNGFSPSAYLKSGRYKGDVDRSMHRDRPHLMIENIDRMKGWDYWEGVDKSVMDLYDDHKAYYVNASYTPHSQGPLRFSDGVRIGKDLVRQIQDGILDDDELIRIVGHSQGAAFAAGMATQLRDAGYSDRIHFVWYLNPHHPNSFEHPSGVYGHQWYNRDDWVVTAKWMSASTGNGPIPGVTAVYEGYDAKSHSVKDWGCLCKRLLLQKS